LHLLLFKIGKLKPLMCAMLTYMASLMKKFTWSNLKDLRHLEENIESFDFDELSMDLNRLDFPGGML
jgi:hypothetical protein